MEQANYFELLKKMWISGIKGKFSLDLSRSGVTPDYMRSLEPILRQALQSMQALEKGAIANPDEKRMVGHYWLRTPELAPTPQIRAEIEGTIREIEQFAVAVHGGHITPPGGGRFQSVLVIGIGGSALGPKFVSDALSTGREPLDIYYFDNTDPDGIARTLSAIPDLSKTLCVVISKSGGTKETRNGQLLARAAYQAEGIEYARCFVAVTGKGSELDQQATKEQWLKRFPMWDWVGGRTSEWSAVGLLPAALQGFDIRAFLQGGAEMDQLTRIPEYNKNPAAALASVWWYQGKGRGERDMVVLPYRDRLELFSRYLQQLVMESLGKEHDLNGKVVHQGIAVYGNKGSTDQHAYVQQLRDGVHNFFVVFIEVLRDRFAGAGPEQDAMAAHEVEPGITAGDYLAGFYLGTRKALHDRGRESVTITIEEVNAFSVGMLIALFERAVGLYASMANINAYHQPGVEAGKKAATEVLKLQSKAISYLTSKRVACTVSDLAIAIQASGQEEDLFKIMERLVVNQRLKKISGTDPFSATYALNS